MCISPPRDAVSIGEDSWPTNPMSNFPCPVCEYLTLPDRGMYSICPVCFWEDDGVGESPDWVEIVCGPNHVSFIEARENFKILGAAEPDMVEFVREPLPEEIPE